MPPVIDFSNPSLLYSLAWTLIEQKDRKTFKVFGRELSREQCLYEIYLKLPSFLPNLRIQNITEIDNEKILTDFASSVLEAIKKAQPEASGPTAIQLEVLVEEYQAHLQELAKDEEIKPDLLHDQLSLENQLKLITQYHQFREQLKLNIKNRISPFYPESFRDQVADQVAEQLFQHTAGQVKALAPADQVFIEKALQKIFKDSPEADISFSSQEKADLKKTLNETLGQINPQQLVEGFLCQDELIKTSLPKRDTVAEKVRTLGLNPAATSQVLNQTETLRLTTSQPTEFMVREALRQALRPYGIIEDSRIESLVPYFQHYLIAQPVSQAQNQPFPNLISRYALKISQKLKLSPSVVQDSLNGLSSDLLKTLSQNPNLKPSQKQIFIDRLKAITAFEENLKKTPGLRLLKLRIGWAQRKATLLNFVDTNNPFSPVFYQTHFSDLRNWYQAQQKYYQETGQYLKTQGFLGLLSRPKQAIAGWWNGLLARSQTLQSFVNFLPKLSPSYFIGRKLGGFFVRTGASWLAQAGGQGLKAAAGRFLGFLGAKLLGKAAGSAIGTVLAGPVGTVVGFVAGSVLGKIFNKENLKKLLIIAGGALAGLGILLLKFLSWLFATAITGIFTLLGAGLGFLVGGPLGALLGGAAGAGLGHLLSGWLGKGGLAQTGQNLLSGAKGLLAAPTATGLSSAMTFLPVFGVGAGLGITFIVVTTKAGAFIPKELGGGIDAPINSVVTPDCDHTACKIIAQLKSCGLEKVTTGNFSSVENCLASRFPKATEEFERSVTKVSEFLQCVGFKIGAEAEEGINLPHQHAAAFIYNHPGCSEISPPDVKMGDNVVWGPRAACPTQDPKEAVVLCDSINRCCGHIGVVTKVHDFVDSLWFHRQITVTQAWGNNGQVGSNTITTNKAAGGPWVILRCK